MFVVHVIVNVAHLVVNYVQIIHGNFGAHFDSGREGNDLYFHLLSLLWGNLNGLPEIFSIIQIPGGCVTVDLTSISWLLEYGVVPEFLRHGIQAKADEKIL